MSRASLHERSQDLDPARSGMIPVVLPALLRMDGTAPARRRCFVAADCAMTVRAIRAIQIMPAVVTVLVLLTMARPALAQRSVRITGDRLSGVVLPVEPQSGDIRIKALRGWVWTVDDTQRLVLQQDVSIRVAGQEFTANNAIVWINRMPSRDGVINQIAIYFDTVLNPKRRAGVGVAGEELLVTGSTRGSVSLNLARLDRERPGRSGLLTRGERRLARHIRELLANPPSLRQRPRVDRPPSSHAFVPQPGGRVEPRDYELPSRIDLPSADHRRPWLKAPGALIQLSYGTIRVRPGETENVIVVTDSIVVEYSAAPGSDELAQLTLSADRAVVFTDPGTLEEMTAWQLDASIVHGIYLEGNVIASANDGDYLVRAPRVYYDFTTDRAVMLNAVLRTYERNGRVPVYARADELRQIAQNQWDARRVRVSTSEFFSGHFSIGADRMTVTRRPVRNARGGWTENTERETHLHARDITLSTGDLPIFKWPVFSGTVDEIPLRGVQVDVSDENGVGIRTAWDLFSLLGTDRPDGVDAELKIDGFTKRGAALGLEYKYDVAEGEGLVDLYGLYDDGTDLTSAGERVRQDGEFRGIALMEHQTDFARHWLLQAQASYVSDESFVTTWREDDFKERREYETSAYIKRQVDRSALTLLTKYEINDFLSNDYLLASQAYSVEKLPELTYNRFGDPWFGDAVTYSGQFRASRMRLSFQEGTPRDAGMRGSTFGIGEDDDIDDSLRAKGLSSSFVNRIDSRHEFAMPLNWGPVQITPFATGRLTMYDEAMEEDSSSDTTRWFGAAGVRINTQFQHVDNSAESRLFDVHRLRHIVEPSLTFWYGHSDVDDGDIPIYDYDVESVGDGTATRMGVRNTWQTQRGGPGQWRSVDVLTLNTDIVLTSDDANRESPNAQFFDYRPEFSQFGEHVRQTMIWLLSDSFSISGEATYDLDESEISRGSIGAELRHSPVLSTYVEYRYLNASDNELLGVGWNYRLTRKYRIGFTPQWDFVENDFRAVDLRVTRSFPDFDVTIRVRHDQIKDDTTFAASVGLVEF